MKFKVRRIIAIIGIAWILVANCQAKSVKSEKNNTRSRLTSRTIELSYDDKFDLPIAIAGLYKAAVDRGFPNILRYLIQTYHTLKALFNGPLLLLR